MTGKLKILLADDHLVVRMGLSAIIGIEKDLTVVGEASDGEEAVRLATALKPDIVIMDLMMPRLKGAEATERIRRICPQTQVLILTTFGTSDELRRALDAGAIGALVKDSAHGELIAAIRAASRGEAVFSPDVRKQLAAPDPSVGLSQRQLDILRYVAKGFTNAEIAPLVGIGPDCVKAHLKTIFTRLDAASRSEAVALALQKRLIEL